MSKTIDEIKNSLKAAAAFWKIGQIQGEEFNIAVDEHIEEILQSHDAEVKSKVMESINFIESHVQTYNVDLVGHVTYSRADMSDFIKAYTDDLKRILDEVYGGEE